MHQPQKRVRTLHSKQTGGKLKMYKINGFTFCDCGKQLTRALFDEKTKIYPSTFTNADKTEYICLKCKDKQKKGVQQCA